MKPQIVSVLLIFTSFVLSTSPAFAADSIELNVPRSELPQKSAYKYSTTSLKYINIDFSSWSPTHLKQDSRLPQTTSFQKSGREKISLYYSSAFSNYDSGLVSTQFGFSYLQMERSGLLKFESAGINVSHQVDLYQILMGAEWKSHKVNFTQSKIFANLRAIPTWVQSTKSEFNSGLSEWRWMTAASLGLQWSVAPLGQWLGFDDMVLNLALEQSKDFSGNSLDGSGIIFGTKIGFF